MVEINKRLVDLYTHKKELLQEEDSGQTPLRAFAEMLKSIHEFYTSSKTAEDEYVVTVEDVELDGLFHYSSSYVSSFFVIRSCTFHW